MKKLIRMIILTGVFATYTIFMGCTSREQKSKAAKINQAEARQDSIHRQKERTEEWEIFKKETEEKIRENEMQIAKLTEKKTRSGKILDAIYEKQIDMLEQQNEELKSRLNSNEKDLTG